MPNVPDNNDDKKKEPEKPRSAEDCYLCGTRGYAPDPVRHPGERKCPNCGANWDAFDAPPARYKPY